MQRESSQVPLSACTSSPRAMRGRANGCPMSFRDTWQRYMTVFESVLSRTKVVGESTSVNIKQTRQGRCGVHQVRQTQRVKCRR